MKRYLVTGGAGFIGSAVSNRLIEEGNFVRILDNGFRKALTPLSTKQNVEFIKADIRNFEDVQTAFKNIDSVIHLAYINGTRYFYENPDLVLEVAVKGMINVIDASRKYKVKELYLASSSEVYQTPPHIPTPETVPLVIPDVTNPRYSYAGGKIISELLSLYNGKKIFKKVVIFRPHNVYGPDMGFEHVIPELIKKIIILKLKNPKKISLPIQGKGNQTRAFIYIDDFVDALMLLLRSGGNGQIYNIGTQEEISIKNLILQLSLTTGVKISLKPGPDATGGTSRRCPDISKLKLLGFKAKTPLKLGLKKTYIWYNNNLP